MLADTGRLPGPSIRAGALDLSPGDWVVAGSDGIGSGQVRTQRGSRCSAGLGVPQGFPGDVRLVDPAGAWAIVDFPSFGVVRLPTGALARLRHGYALAAPPGIGTHVAGLRVARPARLGPAIPGA